ncbi:hypothetical protein [Streptomyces sparsogenes]|uniref:hypothetical protein n=1 Tax=Streptomyces sparsogenes TaxID=67365 RepID=UPI0033CE6BE0
MSDARRDRYRRAIADADDVFAYEQLEPHDYQRHTDAVMAVADEEIQHLQAAQADRERERNEAHARFLSVSRQLFEVMDERLEAVRERDRLSADVVRFRADLLTARHDLQEFARELEVERAEWESERAGYEGTIRAMDDVAASLRNEIRELKDLVVAQARRLAKLEGEA